MGRLWCVRAVFVGVCLVGTSVGAQEFELAPADHIAPLIRHDPPVRAAPGHQPLTIDAIVTDNIGLERVTLRYRAVGATEYRAVEMVATVGDRFAGVIDASEVVDPGIEYYIQAEDAAGNSAMRGFAFSPLMAAVGAPAPPIEPASGEPKPWYKKPVVWAVVGGVAVAAAVAGGGGGGSSGAGGETVTITGTAP